MCVYLHAQMCEQISAQKNVQISAQNFTIYFELFILY